MRLRPPHWSLARCQTCIGQFNHPGGKDSQWNDFEYVEKVEAFDPDTGDGFSTLEIYGPEAQLLNTFNCEGAEHCVGSFELPVTAATYVVAKAIQLDGDWLVSAPIWVEP